jgi:hypothetical protein
MIIYDAAMDNFEFVLKKTIYGNKSLQLFRLPILVLNIYLIIVLFLFLLKKFQKNKDPRNIIIIFTVLLIY